MFRQLGTITKCFVNISERVFYRHKEARSQLRLFEPRVEKSGARVGEFTTRESIVSFLYFGDVGPPKPDRHAKVYMLGTFYDLVTHFGEV
ncbi:hypothetical protein PBCV1_A631L [Paramecium bursaria Chlorella virus 1]|uniref:Uncharacterized protein n=1 Tax=Paramecium bursaria Chlorella virus 1 TaxID=10506 RepID=O41113_PBCV1|nr:hypothetical protein PBCV1_A631L [Paramecium bursaria Chlorella virus 1]AAC97030.1 hypothetical protein [Paramecium bursaria Chlorella virus 1]